MLCVCWFIVITLGLPFLPRLTRRISSLPTSNSPCAVHPKAEGLWCDAHQIFLLPFVGNHAPTHSVSNQAPQALLITMYFHTHRASCPHAHQIPLHPSPDLHSSDGIFAVCSLTHEKSQDCGRHLPACGSKAASEALSSSHCCSSLGFGVAEPPGSMRRCHAFLWSVIMERWAVTQLWEACPTGPGPPPQTSESLP